MDKPWKVILAFVAVFMAGSIFGGFFALRIGRQVAEQNRPGAPARNPGPSNPLPAAQLLRRFADRLELTDKQRETLRPVVSRAEEQLGRIRQSSLEQTEAILRRMQQEFRAELTAPQLRLLDRMQRIQNENLRREREQRQRGMNFVPKQQSGIPGRSGGQDRPFNSNPDRPDQAGPNVPPNRQFERPLPGPRPEFNRERPEDRSQFPREPGSERKDGPDEGEPRPRL